MLHCSLYSRLLDVSIRTGHNLRSATVGSSLSRRLALLANIATGSIRSCTATASLVVCAWLAMSLDILHRFILITVATSNRRQLLLNIHLLAIQNSINDLDSLELAVGELRLVVVLWLRLQPEHVALSGRCELEDADTGVGFGGWLVGLWGVGDEVGVHEDDQVEVWLGDLLRAWAPAEVSELCRAVS